MPSNTTQIEAFTGTRLQQIADLTGLIRDHGDEFNELGEEIVNRAIVSMVQDCDLAGVDPAIIDAALTGNASKRPR